MKLYRPLWIFLLLLVIGLSTINMYRLEHQRRLLKEDLIELSNIKYGFFSIDEWKQILSEIITQKVGELNFNPDQKEEMRVKISTFLHRTIDDFEKRFYEEKSSSFKGWIQSGITNLTGMFEKMKKDIPVFTSQILNFLSHGENREKIRSYILEKLTDYTDKTFSKIDYTEHNLILEKYTFGDRIGTINGLTSEIERLQDEARNFLVVIFIMVLLIGTMVVFSSPVSKTEYLLYIFVCFLLLSAGLLLPMIEIDARLEEVSFTLLGEPVAFTDQVLYYKSKSILEVVQLMLTQGKMDVWLVGVLVLLFSVLFPVSKLLTSVTYLYYPGLHANRFIRFMVFRTGKWSMADVMVIAIFMSYIGFSSILTEQLRQLESLTRTIDILTTNKSSLQVGFFLFTSFAILSLLVAHRMQYSFFPFREKGGKEAEEVEGERGERG